MCIYMSQNYYTRNIDGQKVQVYDIVDAWKMSPWIAQATQYLLRAKFKGNALSDYQKCHDHIQHEMERVASEPGYCLRYGGLSNPYEQNCEQEAKYIGGKFIYFNEIADAWNLDGTESSILWELLGYSSKVHKGYEELMCLSEASKKCIDLMVKESDKIRAASKGGAE